MYLIVGCLLYFILSFYIWLKAYRVIEEDYWNPKPTPTWFSVIFLGCFICQLPPVVFVFIVLIIVDFLTNLDAPRWLHWLGDEAKLPKIKITWS